VHGVQVPQIVKAERTERKAMTEDRKTNAARRRTILKGHQFYYRWCFSDLPTARAFIEEFGGSLLEP
jgi:hypothetical protein